MTAKEIETEGVYRNKRKGSTEGEYVPFLEIICAMLSDEKRLYRSLKLCKVNDSIHIFCENDSE